MTKDEMREEFEKNVNYLRKIVPPDDIYEFAEQTVMAAMFFLKKWGEWEDINSACDEDLVIKKWVLNIVGLIKCRNENIDINLDLNLDSVESDENNT